MAESLTGYTADGSSVALTNYVTTAGTAFITARRGFAAPPVEVRTERLPQQAGARYTGTLTRERVLALSLVMTATSWTEALEKFRTLITTLMSVTYFESIANGRTRRLNVYYRAGLEGDSSAREGSYLRVVAEYVATDPYWYDPTPGSRTIDMTATTAGLSFPVTFPAFFGTAGGATAFTVTAGDVGSPWELTLLGPLTGVKLTRLDTNEVLNVSSVTVGAGQTLHLSTYSGAHKILLDNGLSVQTMPGVLSDDSVFWQLKAGSNSVAVVITGGTTAQGTLTWTNYYLGPG